jgi:hypothetical protein
MRLRHLAVSFALASFTFSPAAFAEDELAGVHGGLVYLRDRNDNFRLYIQGRAQVDQYNYFGPGVGDVASLKSTFLLRRIRPEISGEFLHTWQFMLAGDWGQTGNDNTAGTNETSAAAPGSAPTAGSGRYAGAQTPTLRAQPTDVWLAYAPAKIFHLQVGQYDAPFMLENRTSDKYIPFMERSLAVRALGIPTNKEMGIMAWGETDDSLLYYSAGIFNGDGQNRVSPDSRADAMGRVFIHPLHGATGAIKDLQIGASGRWGVRDAYYVGYDYPGMSTQGGYTFWKTTYGGSKGQTHILPSGTQMAIAGEVRVPFDIFDFTGEFVYVNNHTRESVEGYQLTNTERLGSLKGFGYYAQFGVWLFGPRDVSTLPGYENPASVNLKKPDPEKAPQALQLLVKWEQLSTKYDSAGRGGTADVAKNVDGDIKINALSLGANYWATKHVRLTANYVLNMFPDSEPTSPTATGGPTWSSSQRALAPGNTVGKGINDSARDGAHVLHELLFRAAVAF